MARIKKPGEVEEEIVVVPPEQPIFTPEPDRTEPSQVPEPEKVPVGPEDPD